MQTAPGSPISRIVGWTATVAAVVLMVIVQWVNDDWLPPEISLSQYGLGPNGWLFNLCLISIGVAGLAWYRCGPPNRLTLLLVGVGAAGSVIAALIPTQPGGAQETWNATVHMIGSIMLVAFLPFGLCRLVRVRPRWWWRVADVLLLASAVTLLLLLFAALGWDTAGLGPQRSWALWQGVSVVWQLSLLVWVGLARGLGPWRQRRAVPAE